MIKGSKQVKVIGRMRRLHYSASLRISSSAIQARSYSQAESFQGRVCMILDLHRSTTESAKLTHSCSRFPHPINSEVSVVLYKTYHILIVRKPRVDKKETLEQHVDHHKESYAKTLINFETESDKQRTRSRRRQRLLS